MGVNHPNLPKVNVPGLPKKVVLKKPKLDKPVDLKAKAPVVTDIKPEQKIKSIERQLPKEEVTLDIEELPQQEIIQTKERKRTIIIKREPVKSLDTIIVKNEPHKTFDEKFLDNLHVRSQIKKDEKTLHELKKPEIKPTVKTKTTKKQKRKFNPYIVVSLILFILLSAWSYKIMKDYLSNVLDGSLASFMFVVVSVTTTIMMFIWFIIEILIGDEK